MTNAEKSKLIAKLMDLNEQLSLEYDKISESIQIPDDEGMKKLDQKVNYNQGARFCINYVINHIMNEEV